MWDFLKPAPALAASLALPKNSGVGKTVAILGAGVSGLCAAYELDRAGYEVMILEAQRRAGGRSLTLRRGDVFQELNQPAQTCEFDDGLYLNAGPGRIPHHHVNYIDYCRRFGVAMQPYIFASRANLVHSSTLGNGRTVPVREALYSLQGHVANCSTSARASPASILPVSGDDLAKLQEMLGQFGDLTTTPRGFSYQNQSGRAGLARRGRSHAGKADHADEAGGNFALARVGRLDLPRCRHLLADLAARAGRRHGPVLEGFHADSPAFDRTTRSWGRFGPARLGSTVARSRANSSEYCASGVLASWNRPCSFA